MRDSLLDLASAAEARNVTKARDILGQIDKMVGPHFRYEEDQLYSTLREFLGDYADSLVAEHDGFIDTAKTAAKLLSQSSLSEGEGKAVAKGANIRPMVTFLCLSYFQY